MMARQPLPKQKSAEEEQPGDINLQDKNVVLNFGTVDVDDVSTPGSDNASLPEADLGSQPSTAAATNIQQEEESKTAPQSFFHPSSNN